MTTQYHAPGDRVAILSDDSTQMQETVETSYQALNGLAVASVVCGALSAVTFIDWPLALVPAIGIALGWIAIRRIRRNPVESVGVNWARSGIILSVAMWVGGYSWLAYGYFNQTPPGYKFVSFKDLQTDPNRPDQRVSEEAEMLDKRKVFIWGYMVPGRQQSGIKEFVLMEDPGTCAYCSPTPKPTQLIRIKLVNNLRTTYTARVIGVGGEFSVHTDPKEVATGSHVYQIDGDCLR
jgi:hypothetical protein